MPPRFPTKIFLKVQDFWQSQDTQAVIKLKANREHKKFIKENLLEQQIEVRFIKVELENGEIEVLGTSLLDDKVYPKEEFKQVYAWRWCQETYYDRVKNIFEIEHFSGLSLLSIKQDFYGVMFLATLESILTKPTQETLDAKSKDYKNPIKVNRCISYISLLDHCVELFLDKHSTDEFLAKLEFLFSTDASRHLTSRKFERNKTRKYSGKLFFNK